VIREGEVSVCDEWMWECMRGNHNYMGGDE